MEQNFFCKITLGHTFEVSVVTVPLSVLVHPLCVIPDYGGDKKHSLWSYQSVIGVIYLEIKLKDKHDKCCYSSIVHISTSFVCDSRLRG